MDVPQPNSLPLRDVRGKSDVPDEEGPGLATLDKPLRTG
jgi:hypothetical protein